MDEDIDAKDSNIVLSYLHSSNAHEIDGPTVIKIFKNYVCVLILCVYLSYLAL